MSTQPLGALNRQPENTNFLSRLQFRFSIRKLPNTNFFVQKVNLPGIHLQTAWQPTPLQKLPLPGTSLTYDELTVTFAVDENFANYFELFDWVNGIGFPKDFSQYASIKNESRDVSSQFGGILSDAVLHILSNESQPIANIIFRDSFPITLSQIDFDTTLEDFSPVTATASFRYALIDKEKPTL